MWIFARNQDGTGGFLSVVQHNQDQDLMLVRARRQRDLASAFPALVPSIQEDPKADYRWRLEVPRHELMGWMADVAFNLDYESHVKEEVSGDDEKLYSAMLRIWSVMNELQQNDGKPDEPKWFAEDWEYEPRSTNDDYFNDDDDDVESNEICPICPTHHLVKSYDRETDELFCSQCEFEELNGVKPSPQADDMADALKNLRRSLAKNGQ